MILEKEFFGLGTDIENIDKFSRFDNKKNSFLKKIFTQNELDYCFSKKDIAAHLAARYSGKEAVIKAINNFNELILDYRDIEIINNKNGAPLVKLKNKNLKNIYVKISLSHTNDKVTAVAIALKSK